MDIISQILLSICFTYACFYKTFGYWGLAIGCLCTLIIDVPPFFTHVPLFNGLDHAHSITHSLFTLLGLLLCSIPIGYFIFKKVRPFVLLILLNYTIHIIVDLSSSNGVTLFAPLSDHAYALQSLSRWDIFLIFPLLSGLLSSFFLSQRKWVHFSCVYTLIYVIGAHFLSLYAYQNTASKFKQIGFSPEKIHITTPPLFFFIRRLSVKDAQGRFACTFYSPFLQRPSEIFTKKSLDNALVQALLEHEEGATFSKFTHDMILVQKQDDLLLFSDARHGSFIDPWASPYRAHASVQQVQNPTLTISHDFPRRPFRDEIPQAWKLLFPYQGNSR